MIIVSTTGYADAPLPSDTGAPDRNKLVDVGLPLRVESMRLQTG
jgi:hypothetical protein